MKINENSTKKHTEISAENNPKPAKFQEPRKAKKRAETVAGARFLGFRELPKTSKKASENGFGRQPGSKRVLEGAWARFWLDVGLHFGV